MAEPTSLILDTHAWIWFVDGSPELSVSARRQIESIAAGGEILISSISVWEVGMLENRGRLRLTKAIWDWINDALSAPALRLVPLSAAIALESCFLPGRFHQDPADRFIVATARIEQATIVSRDRRILAYAKQGHVDAIPA